VTSAQTTLGQLEPTTGFDLQQALAILEATSLPIRQIFEANTERSFSRTFLYTGVPNWFDNIDDQLQEFLSLEPNWDSYGAEPIDEDITKKTLELILLITEENTPEPFVAPVPSGGIDIEWNKQARLLSIKVRKDEIRYLLFNRDGTPNQKGQIPDDKSIDKLIALWGK